ncbi:MAG: hypothetical protein EHM20_15465 [Alphaproteobacteria bacterium]|nr:MAG: hypothetical protein EHM20_15465 [Alphaproteobacteria bacterium]
MKILISSFLNSLMVNKKYAGPEIAVVIKKNINSSGALYPGPIVSIFSFSAKPAEKEAISI